MNLNWNFQRIGGVPNQISLWGEYGYFLEQNEEQFNALNK